MYGERLNSNRKHNQRAGIEKAYLAPPIHCAEVTKLQRLARNSPRDCSTYPLVGKLVSNDIGHPVFVLLVGLFRVKENGSSPANLSGYDREELQRT